MAINTKNIENILNKMQKLDPIIPTPEFLAYIDKRDEYNARINILEEGKERITKEIDKKINALKKEFENWKKINW
jgi:hypothetical protein|tara:strand:+ start:64 stop:288 length:225 start_codon:yes stop_codon:yes gene_type:complete